METLVDTDVEPARRARPARSARRDNSARIAGIPYIARNIPTYDILSEENLQKIERVADRILSEVGIEFRDDPVSLEHWKRAGAKVDGLLVRFEPGMLNEIVSSAPAQFTQHARNPAHNVEIGGKNVVFAPAYGSPFVMDLDKGRRYGTLEDFRNFIKLAQSSPWLHHSGGTICEPVDIPVNKRHLDMVYSHIKYSDRAFMGSITQEDRAEDSIDMARIVFGRDFVDRNCVILGNVNVNSPLVWDGTMTKSLRAYARANQAAVIVPFILGGAMGPVTNAGAIAQSYAETLAGCALTQLERKGAPVIFGNFLSSMSLRSGSPTFGTPEPAIGSMVIGQLARRLKLPLRCAGNFSNSKLPDGQAMQEGVMSMLSAVHCGANFILHSAGFLDGLLAMSYEKFVMDTDFCGARAFLSRPASWWMTIRLPWTPSCRSAPAAIFSAATTRCATTTTAFWDSALSDNEPFEKWSEEGGSTDMATRANRRWKKTLAEYEAPPLDVAIDDALAEYMTRRKNSMADAWY